MVVFCTCTCSWGHGGHAPGLASAKFTLLDFQEIQDHLPAFES